MSFDAGRKRVRFGVTMPSCLALSFSFVALGCGDDQALLQAQAERIEVLEQRLETMERDLAALRVTLAGGVGDAEAGLDLESELHGARTRGAPRRGMMGATGAFGKAVVDGVAAAATEAGRIVGEYESGPPAKAERPQTPDDHYSTSGAQGVAGQR